VDPKYDDTEFKLSTDATMDRLQQIAQEPGELRWRQDLLRAMERDRITRDIQARSTVQQLGEIRKLLKELTLQKLEVRIDKRIEAKRKELDGTKWRTTVKWIMTHVGTALVSLLAAYLLYRLKR
jgi:hypothetical protein